MKKNPPRVQEPEGIPVIREQEEAKEEAGTGKNEFLANLSHEIRTPMNIIIGMSELALREEISAKARAYIADIKRAGASLLSLINDILDFLEIESGRTAIEPAEYLFTSLINDCVNIIAGRLGQRRIRFVTNIDSSIPRKMIGDVTRLRQILAGVLGGALKYTREGHFSLSVTPGSRRGDKITLNFTVTGTGIKDEDKDKLFDDFISFDSRGKGEIGRTGPGLGLSRNLCRLMGGDITVQSTRGAGSTFTITVPQTVADPAPIAEVKDPQTKSVLLYERREIYGESIAWSLANLGARVTKAAKEELLSLLEKEDWPFVFVSPDMAEPSLDLIRKRNLNSTMAILANPEDIRVFQHIPLINSPAYTVPISSILNGAGKGAKKEWVETSFTAPSARILIVDDIVTNLKVAEGLLSVYRAKIHTCAGGAEAVALVKEHNYDIVFMDHMMPGMDGVEAAGIIRSWEESGNRENPVSRRIPLIALTANTVSGAKEMFLAKGFDDYLAKPIEISRLEEIMARWIPGEKKEKAEALPGKRC
ncbi:MAG: response regulator [Treponema sp.]|jgi:CheY-like chemotaxis protein|nr:response regulator [Treponema sp.]